MTQSPLESAVHLLNSDRVRDITLAIRRCALFRGLTSSRREGILRQMELVTLPPATCILSEGETVQALWIVLRGQCRVTRSTRSGEQQQLAVLDSGSTFGEVSFFSRASHSASVQASTEVDLAGFRREQFDTLLERCPEAAAVFSSNIAAIASERLRQMDDWVCTLVEERGLHEHRSEWNEFRSRVYSALQFDS